MRLCILLVSFGQLLCSAVLSGRVAADDSGAAVASADVRVFRNGVRGVAAELETDGEGRFRAEGLAEGEYRLEIAKANHIASNVHIKLSEASPSEVAARLVRCGSIRGRVVDGQGKPLSKSVVYSLRSGAGPLKPERAEGRFAHVQDDGTFRIYNLPPGQYLLAASYGASTVALGGTGQAAPASGVGSGVQLYPTNARPQPFTITGGEALQNIEFSVLATNVYSVSGSVEGGARPRIEGAFWMALVLPEQPSISMAAAMTKEDGSFRFDGIPSGVYDLLASGPSRGRNMFGAVLEGDAIQYGRTRVTIGSQNVEGLSIGMAKGATVTVALKTPTADCGATGQLTLTAAEDWAAGVERRSAIGTGDPLILKALAPAKYRVSVTGLGDTCFVPEGSTLDLTTAARGADPWVLTAIPAGKIQGSVQGASTAGVAIVLTGLSDSEQPLQVSTAGADGKFTFAPLKPGRYRVAAKAGTRWSSETEGVVVDVQGGATANVAVALPVPVRR